MSLGRNVSVTSAVFLAALLSPAQAHSLEPMPVSWDYSAVAQKMRNAGYGDLAAGRQFAAFDPSGDGRAVEVLGDLSSARHVVVFVPGSDTTLADFDRGLGGVARRAPSTQARWLRAAILARQPQARVAVVAWLGYDPPEGLGLAAVRQNRAADGAAALTRFIAALPPQATVTVVGHSYGTVVMALAAPAFGSRVTNLVALASPGLNARAVTELSPHCRLWTATAPTDWIVRIPHIRIGNLGHGPIPDDAHLLPTEGVSGHDGYLTPGSATLAAIADVVAFES
jgi:pimeloyl-ACP methyl ester carboxylesterase